MEIITLQNRKNPAREIEVTQEQYEKLKELGHGRAWQIVATTNTLNPKLQTEVEQMIDETRERAKTKSAAAEAVTPETTKVTKGKIKPKQKENEG